MSKIGHKLGRLLWAWLARAGRSANRLEVRTCVHNGRNYRYLVSKQFSKTQETLVLLHGLSGFKDYWLSFIRALNNTFNIIAIDLPGHGDSDFDPNVEFARLSLALVGEIISIHGVKPVHLVGASIGGWVAAAFAVEKPSAVATLTMIGPAGVPVATTSEFYAAVDQGRNPYWVSSKQEYAYLLSLALHQPQLSFWPLSEYFYQDYLSRLSVFKQIWSQLSDDRHRLKALDLDALARLDIPKFAVWGDHERTFHRDSLAVLSANIPGLIQMLCAESGHAVQCDQPKWLAEWLSSVLSPNQPILAN